MVPAVAPAPGEAAHLPLVKSKVWPFPVLSMRSNVAVGPLVLTLVMVHLPLIAAGLAPSITPLIVTCTPLASPALPPVVILTTCPVLLVTEVIAVGGTIGASLDRTINWGEVNLYGWFVCTAVMGRLSSTEPSAAVVVAALIFVMV